MVWRPLSGIETVMMLVHAVRFEWTPEEIEAVRDNLLETIHETMPVDIGA